MSEGRKRTFPRSYMNKKSEQLGMPFSTAQARLDRMVLFVLVQKVGLDACYRCGGKIERWQDLSMEHKESWLDVDPVLFWDLNNIAFSHKTCNYGSTKRWDGLTNHLSQVRLDRRRLAPEGMAWCAGHKDYLATDEFSKNPSNVNGLHHYCKSCRQAGK